MKKTFLILFFSSLAMSKSININPLMTGLNSSYLGLEDASLSDQPFSVKRTPGRTFIYLNYDWDKSPWVLLSKDKKKKVEDVVESMHTIEMGFSWLLGDSMQLGVTTFGSLVNVAPQYGGDSTAHLGDTRLQFKYRFLTDTYWNMAIAPEITVPTGVEYVGHRYGAGLSNSSFAPGVKFIGEYRTSENQWTFNLGYNYYDQAEFKSPTQSYPTIDGRSRIFIGTGWLMRLSQRWALDSEYSTQLTPGENHFTPPGLLTLGTRYQPANTLSWNFGLGTGSLGGPGGNDILAYVGVKVPLFGSTNKKPGIKEGFGGAGRYEDPLLQEAYKKQLIDHSSDQTTLKSQEFDSYFNNNPVEPDSGKSLYTPRDELTKRALFDKN